MTSAEDDRLEAGGADAEAASWFAKLQSRSIGISELRDFAGWRRDPANAAAYLKVEELWRSSAGLEDDPDIAALVQKAAASRRSRPWSLPWSRNVVLAGIGLLAATCIIAAAVGSFAFDHGRSYRTAHGVRSFATLDDGTRMQIDADTAVVAEISDSRRHLRLDRGQAFFSVKHDPSRPFIVDVGSGMTVTAVGTEFDVRRTEESIGVALLKGVVEVRRGSDLLATLHPGEALEIGTHGETKPVTRDPESFTGWRSGRLSFRGERLQDALGQVNRYAGAPLVLTQPKFASEPISGEFDAGDPDAFLKAVNALLGEGTVSAGPMP